MMTFLKAGVCAIGDLNLILIRYLASTVTYLESEVATAESVY